MKVKKLYIKNVVCQRCIMAVKEIFNNLNIPFSAVNLGEAILERKLSAVEKEKLQTEFEKLGFDIIENRNEKLINKIKSLIIKEVYSEGTSNDKLSTMLNSHLHLNYGHITHIFTDREGQSIQQFYNSVRIERVKELLNYDDWSIVMIADNLGYSSAAYLSTSFKKATGLSPSGYRKLQVKDRKSLDMI
ncbi:helix-turn-helix transcriptional regulator [Zunongwangia sp. SCSIO 43204]|uniref:AraC family transcriptional regulator n=2 Tax=Flavobacteriales TaxID=200644 RepID=A0ABU3CXC9_9FLAO|nr:AraC family transcriptional regulator [Zunongwangia sp. F297]MDT0650893.1 AraC family transcriptional regulator [Zunongwangia sp. F297]UAB83091.1 helix-turn-helix transcriptional regulator [Zunongwangia sp. SCSIO 43204]